MALSRGGGGSGNSALSKRDQAQHPIEQSSSQHTPRAARGFCLLDTPESFWKNGYCPYDLSSNNTESKVGVGVGKYVIERIDFGSSFYKNHFYGQGEFWLDIYFFHIIFQLIKFIYSEKATKFCEISTVDLSYVLTVKSTVEISQNFVAFSEYKNVNVFAFYTLV